MPAINEIPNIGKGSLELLDAAGIRDAEHLAKQDPKKLTAELQRANEVLSISKRSPGIATVDKWISAAAELIGEQPGESTL
jgi:nucleotidyltransferase/DNA polymerase involved in DNA repair